MDTIKIYGTSDDLVEIEGKVRGCDEYGFYSDKPGYVELSTGDVFSIQYTGTWNIMLHVQGSGLTGVDLFACPKGDDEDNSNYSDVLTATGPIEWVKFWTEWPVTVSTKRDVIQSAIEQLDDRSARRMSGDCVNELYDVLYKHNLIR